MTSPEITRYGQLETLPIVPEEGKVWDALGHLIPAKVLPKRNLDGSVELATTLSEDPEISCLELALDLPPLGKNVEVIKFMGADTSSNSVSFNPNNPIMTKIRESFPDHQWTAPGGKFISGGEAHLVMAIRDQDLPSFKDTTLVGFLPSTQNEAEATFSLDNGNISAKFWYDNTSRDEFKPEIVLLRGSFENVVGQYGRLLREHLKIGSHETHERSANLFLWPTLGRMWNIVNIAQNIEIASRLAPPFGKKLIDTVTLDDNTFNVLGDIDPKIKPRVLSGSGFNSIREFVDWSRGKGADIELWLSPFEAAVNSNTVRNHPDYFVRVRDGSLFKLPFWSRRLMLTGTRVRDIWPGAITLFDVRKDEVRKFLSERARELVTTYGITKFKIDFLHVLLQQIFLENSSGLTRVEMARNAMQAVVDGMREGAQEIGKTQELELLFCQVPVTAFLGLELEGIKTKVRFTPDLFPAPLWMNPIPNWTGLNKVVEKMHPRIVKPMSFWNKATEAMELRAPIFAEVAEPLADGPILGLGKYGVPPNLTEEYVRKLSQERWSRTLLIGNDLSALSNDALKKVVSLINDFKSTK